MAASKVINLAGNRHIEGGIHLARGPQCDGVRAIARGRSSIGTPPEGLHPHGLPGHSIDIGCAARPPWASCSTSSSTVAHGTDRLSAFAQRTTADRARCEPLASSAAGSGNLFIHVDRYPPWSSSP